MYLTHQKTTIAGVIALLFSSQTFAADNSTSAQTDEVVVSANRFEHKESETTYASEIHTSKMIEVSGAATLYDYLAQQTSINVLSSFGNKATPSIDMRGYGSASGYQNIVISVDGQRLNNIDGIPQLIGSIPLGNIDRIEITKGSGSVIYGDGAMAGSIQIYTKAKTGVTVSASGGNFGQQTGYVAAGISEQYFDLSASLAHDSNDGFSKKASDGKQDTYKSDVQNIKLKIKPDDSLRFNIEANSARIDVRYPYPLTLAQFKADPSQNGMLNNAAYTHQGMNSDQWRVGFEYAITQELKVSANYNQENKVSEFIGSSVYNYDYTSKDINVQYKNDTFRALIGVQTFDGLRSDDGLFSVPNKTTKNNIGYFVSTEYKLNQFTLSAGARTEDVKYHYVPVGGAALSQSNKDLDAWDVGMNFRFNNETSAFANYNQAFQAPDIDRFFNFVFLGPSVFNGFIMPAQSKTFNIGLNNISARNKFKATTFWSNLDNEIYYNSSTFANTNIDKSHKYGLEIQDTFKITDKLSTSLYYTFTRAIIDQENEGNGAFNRKNLPGVPKQGVVVNFNYTFLQNANLNVSHTWRQSTYSANDFANNLSQKQSAYEATNLALSYRFKNVQWFGSVNNIFEHKNSIQVDDNVIYPVDFARTLRVGMKVDF